MGTPSSDFSPEKAKKGVFHTREKYVRLGVFGPLRGPEPPHPTHPTPPHNIPPSPPVVPGPGSPPHSAFLRVLRPQKGSHQEKSRPPRKKVFRGGFWPLLGPWDPSGTPKNPPVNPHHIPRPHRVVVGPTERWYYPAPESQPDKVRPRAF